MDDLNQFIIPFKNLSEGNHQFNYTIDEKFFENFEKAEMLKGKINVSVNLENTPTLLTFFYNLKGSVNVTCDRCLDEFDMPVDSLFKMYVRFGETRIEQTDELLIIPEADKELNIMQFIYEYINLSLPIQRIHPDDEGGNSQCNKIVLDKLKELSNSGKQSEETDPRWEILKNIKLN